MDNRKKLLAKLLQEVELSKFAQEQIEQIDPQDESKGEAVAEQIFDKFLSEMNFDSLD